MSSKFFKKMLARFSGFDKFYVPSRSAREVGESRLTWTQKRPQNSNLIAE
jgi:hypothetical protein